MKSRWCAILTMLTALAMFAGGAAANELTSGTDGQPVVTEDDDGNDTEPRYQIVCHEFVIDEIEYEVFVKLDRYSGKAWRFHASQQQWVPISEPTARELGPVTTDENHFEVFVHDYLKTDGDSGQVLLRVDLESGKTWTYRGAHGRWEPVAQEGWPAAR